MARPYLYKHYRVRKEMWDMIGSIPMVVHCNEECFGKWNTFTAGTGFADIYLRYRSFVRPGVVRHPEASLRRCIPGEEIIP